MINEAKRKSNFIHTIRRMKYRYDIDLSLADAIEFSEIVQSKFKVINRISRKRNVKIGQFKEKDIVAVYDKTQHCVVTVLPYPYNPFFYDQRGNRRIY